MSLFSRTKPSPAMVVAVIALSFALAGTAIAGPDAITSAVTKSKVKQIAKKQANKQIRKKAGGLSVANAVNAQNAANATNATTAANGAAGYGEFTQTGGVRPGALNMNNLTISTASPAIYCEDQAFKAVVATASLPPAGGNPHHVMAVSRAQIADLGATPAAVGCPAASEWVYIGFDNADALAPIPFQAVGH